MRDKNKRNRLFNYFRKNMKGIIYLQETYSVPGDQLNWTKEWGGSIFLSSGTTHSRGVAILLPKGMEYNIKKSHVDQNGRFICLEGNFNNQDLALLNVYAPTSDKHKEQGEFLDTIIPYLHEYSHKVILAGDLNTYLSDLDKHGIINKQSEYSMRISSLMLDLDLCDIYRVTNPEARRYTWRKMTAKGILQSRLDYIITPLCLMYSIKSISIGYSVYSDHNPVHLELHQLAENVKGRGFWKLNTSLLRDKEYVDKINKIITEETSNQQCSNQGLKWDTIKMIIRGYTISYSAHKAKLRRLHEKELKNDITKVEISMASNPDENTKQEYQTLTRELELINNERTRGNQIRARATHIELNEKNSAYFLNKEKTNYNTKNISTIHLDDGTIVTDPAKITQCQKEFYETLYSDNSQNNLQRNQANVHFLNQNNMPKLDEDEKTLLEQEITINEIAQAIADLPNGKTPGTDGFPVDFYKVFWPKIKDMVFNSIKHAIAIGEMSIDQKRGVLTLIPKKDKDIRQLKNWRPLTLLNTDYKIFAKAMATRLQTVLPNLISNDQNGCMKNRSTYSNIRSTIDVITHVNEKNKHGILAYIDFQKAFDTVSWQFMQSVMETMNFGKYFRDCVETMYNNIESCIMNNGHASTFFKPSRGIRQGCPISANIFILIVEILAHAIRNDPRIQGIQIDGKVYKLSQYADDTCLFLQNEHSLKIALTTFQNFAKCSGLNINMDKSEAIWIGASSNYRHKPLKLRWTRGATCLGVYISNDINEISQKNIENKMQKIEDLLKLWTLRKLTMLGKVRVINTMIVPQLLYIGNVLHIPKKYIDQYNSIITQFIWDNKPPKIKYKTMINSQENGGLGLQDLTCKINSLKLKWINKIMDTNYNSPWKAYLNTKVKVDINELPYHNLNKNCYPMFADQFYNELFTLWAQIHYCNPKNNEEICRQSIWHNSNIQKSQTCIFYKEWQDNHINYIQDLLNKEGSMLTKNEMENKYGITCKGLDYESLTHAIPQAWKRELKKHKSLNLNYHVHKECKIKNGEDMVNIEGITTKLLYLHLVSGVALRPTSEKKWNEKLDFVIDEPMWKCIYTNYKFISDTILKNFQYKITHRILACNYNLKIWKIRDSNCCEECKEIDTIEHMLVQCASTYSFWKKILNWWAANMKMWFEVDTYEIIFGIPNELDENIVNQLNFYIIVAKYYIYKCKKTASAMDTYDFLLEMKNRLIMKKEIIDVEKQKQFDLRWGELAECLLIE
jgi:exonuclease III